jgi:hypothetical protein
MTRNLTATIFAILLLFLASPKVKGEEYFPKAMEGAEWEYSVEYGKHGTVPSVAIQKGKLLMRVVGEETINGKTYTKYQTVSSGISEVESLISYDRRSPEGIYWIDGEHKDSSEYLETPLPVSIGRSWAVQRPNIGLKKHCKAEAIETVEVLEHTYENCLKVSCYGRGRYGDYEAYSYYAPGIGEVKTVTKYGTLKLVTTLDNYRH